MKRTLERITRRILPLIVAANIANIIPAVNPRISYGQECGESFVTKNMNEVETEYTLQCNFNGKERVWTYLDRNGDVKESNRQTWPQEQYNQEVKSAQPAKAASPPIPPKPQVVVAPAPAAPSSTGKSAAEQKAIADKEERDRQNKMLDLADKKFEEDKKAEEKRKADAEDLAKKEAEEKAEADKIAADKKEAERLKAIAEQKKDDEKSIYDYAIGMQETRSSRDDSYNIHFAVESGKVPSASLSLMFNSGKWSFGPFIRTYKENIVLEKDPESRTTLDQSDLIATGIHRRRIDSETLKAIDKYSDSEAGLRLRYGRDFGVFADLGAVEDRERTYTAKDSKVSLTDANGNVTSGPFYATNTSKKDRKSLVPALGVGLELEIANHLTVGGSVHTINGKDIEGKAQLGWRF
ncbi:hypothetical protein HY449_01170 [Candidatus Pacearchaeota archaeon]|nr:hypothetical protein [Candidatus Pacearchaeota archaeon]